MATSQPVPSRAPISDEELLRLPRDGRKYELVDGKIRVSPAGMRHGQVSVRLSARLFAFVAERRLGEVFESSTGFRLPGGNLRCPDVSFVSADRLPGGEAPAGFGEMAPDLAAEVLSPDDDPRYVLDKVGEYLRAGVRLAWIIDPRRKRAAAYRSLTDVTQVSADGTLDGEDVIPGFTCRLAELLS